VPRTETDATAGLGRQKEETEMKVRRRAGTAAMLALVVLALAGTASAGADIVREQFVIELAGAVEQGCDEEILLTAGYVVETIQVFDDPNGRTHFLYSARTVGVVGVGADSGAIYTDSSRVVQTGIGSIEEGFATGGFVEHVRIWSSDGRVQDLVIRWRFHLVKRDLENRVVLDEFTYGCV
jgi:hypothetical protein